ncbi:MAG: hypothetical protein ACJASQ_001603 [Crocinitomicaceae bacterium]|jgi:hypothetical protein
MKIQYCSDLHLEFPENKKFIQDNIVPFSQLVSIKEFCSNMGLDKDEVEEAIIQ